MSSNKNKWFQVVTTKTVSAPNKAEAIEAAKRQRRSSVEIFQISATEAQALAEA